MKFQLNRTQATHKNALPNYIECIVPFVVLRILRIQHISHHSELQYLFKYIHNEYAKYIFLN